MSSTAPVAKRKRISDDNDDPQSPGQAEDAAVTLNGNGELEAPADPAPQASRLSENLKTTSLDALKQTLISIRQATAIASDEEIALIKPNDKRLVFARELLEDRGVERLLGSWERIHDMGIPSIQPLPIFAIANLITLTSCHLPDHSLSLALITRIVPRAAGPGDGLFWDRLHSYLLGAQSHSARSGKGDEVLLLAALQLLTSLVRFASGRFARNVVENIAWNSKSLVRLPTMRRRSGKDKKGASGPGKSTATFARPDIRLSFVKFLLTVLHPAAIPDFTMDETRTAIDSGAATSTKLLLLSQDHAMSHVCSLVKSLSSDPSSVTAYILHVLERSLLKDPKLPRGVLISLVRSADLLPLLVRLGLHGDTLQSLTSRILHELCTNPGRGICFKDNGWYGRTTGDANAFAELTSPPDEQGFAGGSAPSASTGASAAGIYNPLLNFLVQTMEFSPLYNQSHRALLLGILSAATELQPLFMGSTRGVFGGERLEAPPSDPATGGGARLSGLLANRLLGQVLDLPLPPFHADRPPSTSKLLAGLIPPLLTRANLSKGLRHKDRLVRWSTLTILHRVLARVLRFQRKTARFAKGEQSWRQALNAVVKEVDRRLPDLATVLSCLEDGEKGGDDSSTTKETSASSEPGFDYVLVESSLRTGLLLVRILQQRASLEVFSGYDVRKLVSVACLTQRSASEDDGDGAGSLAVAVQLHALRILRLTRPNLLAISAGDSKAVSPFTSLVGLSLDRKACQEVRDAAALVLSESLGATVSQEVQSTASSSLLFEGDDGEFSAWIAALAASDSSAQSEETRALVSLLEECLSRCSKNSYRYLEEARRLIDHTESSQTLALTDDVLPISPLFATLVEQMTIKIEKKLLSSSFVLSTLLPFLCRLVPMIIGRGRPGAELALQASLAAMKTRLSAQTAAASADEQERRRDWALDAIIAVASCGKQAAAPLRSGKIGRTTSGSHAVERLTFEMERPLPLEQRRSLLEKGSEAEHLLLLSPKEENILPAMAKLTSQASEVCMPPGVVLLHALEVSGKDKAAGKQPTCALATESPAIQRFTLRLITKHLQRAGSSALWSVDLALRCLEHTLASSNTEAKVSFFQQSDLADAIGDPTLCARVVSAALKTLSLGSAVTRDCLQALIARVLLPAAEHPAVPLETVSGLLPYMDDAQLTTVWDQLRTSLEPSDAATCVSRLRILREALALLSVLPQLEDDDLLRFLALPNQFAHDKTVAEEVIAVVTSLMRAAALPGLDAFVPHSFVVRQGRLGGATTSNELSLDGRLAWLLSNVPGSDALLAALIHRSSSAAAEFGKHISGKKAKKRDVDALKPFLLDYPMSLRAFLDLHLALDASSAKMPWLATLADAVPSLCFQPGSASSQLFAESAGLLCSLLERSSDTNDSSIVRGLIDSAPEKPGEAFQLGAIAFAASLAAQSPPPEASRPLVAQLTQLLLDRGLAWLVRRFAEDESDSSELLDTVDAFASLVYHASHSGLAQPKPHLADPVIEAGLKRRLTERRQMEMLRQLVRHTPLKSSAASSHFATLLAHPHFNALAAPGRAHAGGDRSTEPVGRAIVVSLLHWLASQHPVTILTTHNAQALLAIYGGTLSLSDRLLFDLFQRMEQDGGRASFLPLARSWTGHSGASASSAPLALDALLSLDPSQTLNTCSGFPRGRSYGHTEAGSTLARRRAVDNAEAVAAASEAHEREMYDPLWVLSLLAAVLNEDVKLTGLQWVSVVRLNAVGVATCALSSKSDPVRAMAAALLSQVYAGIQAADMQEKDHLLLGFDALRTGLSPQDQEGQSTPGTAFAPPVLPLTTTLFFAHHLRAVVFPASILYPLFSRFLLQRTTFDISDVPLLYTTLQSTDPDHWRGHRVWMLRFLRDCLASGGSTGEWRVMKRRYLWDLLASMYTGVRQALHSAECMGSSSATQNSSSKSPTTVTLRQTLALLEDVMLSAAVMPHVATELITRKGLLPWIAQQLALERGYSGVLGGGDQDGGEEARPAEARPLSPRVTFYVSLLHGALTASTSAHGDSSAYRLHAASSGSWLSSTLNVLAEVMPYVPSGTVRARSEEPPSAAMSTSLLSQVASLLRLVITHAGGVGGSASASASADVDMASPDVARPAAANLASASAERLWLLKQATPLLAQALTRVQAEARRLELESDAQAEQDSDDDDEDDEEAELARGRAQRDGQRRRSILQEAAHDLLDCCRAGAGRAWRPEGASSSSSSSPDDDGGGLEGAHRAALELTLGLRSPPSRGEGAAFAGAAGGVGSLKGYGGGGEREREREVEAIRRECVRVAVSVSAG